MKKKNLKTMLQRLSSILYWVAFGLCLAALGGVLVQKVNGDPLPSICGWSSAVVMTGSMEPAIVRGSLILIHEQDGYQAGDVVTYAIPSCNRPITHRIVKDNGASVVTQGDANNTQDDPISKSQIIGKVVWHIGPDQQSTAGTAIIIFLAISGVTYFFTILKRKIERKGDLYEN